MQDKIYPELAEELALIHYCEYNKIDVVFYLQEDHFPEIPVPPTFLRKIRIALEHENIFSVNKLREEFSKLLLINCDLRVIVSYSNWDDKTIVLNYFQRILSTHDTLKIDNESILLILGVREEDEIYWEGHVHNNNWEMIQNKHHIGHLKKIE